MSECHSFDIDVAKDVGVNAAIIFQSFCFWIKKNSSEGVNFKDGCYWSFASIKGLSKLFPYLSEKQIRTAVDVLIEKNYLKKAQMSDNKINRTMWYALATEGKCTRPVGQMHSTDKANVGFAPEGKCNIEDKEEDKEKKILVTPLVPLTEPENEKRTHRKKTRLPENWFLPKEWGVWALEQGLTTDEIRIEADCFADYWHSKGETRADWLATWRNWVRRKQTWRKPAQRNNLKTVEDLKTAAQEQADRVWKMMQGA